MFMNKRSGNGCLFSSDFTSKLLLHCSQQHSNDGLLLTNIPDTSSLPKRYDSHWDEVSVWCSDYPDGMVNNNLTFYIFFNLESRGKKPRVEAST